jgi:deoxyribonuclease V
MALKTTDTPNSKQALYVSVGHKINLNLAIEIVKKCCIYKNPEPIRNADLYGRSKIL